MERRLTAIVSVDAAAYSRQTEIDETTAVREVRALRERLEASASVHGGRMFSAAGDGFMLEFASVSNAIAFADEALASARPPLRVGAHVGEVVVTPDGDLLGHGVNVAARLRALAAPGELIVSGDVRHALQGVLAQRLEPRGVVKLDKMDERIATFALRNQWSAVPAAREALAPGAAALRARLRQMLARLDVTKFSAARAVIGGLALAAVAVPTWLWWRANQPTEYAFDRIELVAGSAAVERFPSLSPDGRFLVYSARSSGEHATMDLYLQSIAGGEPIQLTDSQEEDEGATAWSPDGARIAFVRGDPTWLERRRPCRIFLRAVPAGDERQIGECEGLTDPSRLSWSPTGDSLLYTDKNRVVELDLATGAVREPYTAEVGGSDFNATYSPDGRRFAFVRYTANYTAHVMVVDPRSARARRVFGDINSQAWIAWAPDGRSIFVAANLSGGRDLRTDLWQVRVDGSGAPRRLGAPDAAFLDVASGLLALNLNHLSVNVVRLSNGEETPVTDGMRHDFDPDFSRDGVLAFTSSQDDSWLYVQQPGAEPHRVAQLDMNAPRRVKWSPDGGELALLGEVDSRQRIFIVDGETGRTREVQTPGLIPQSVDWSNDGSALVFAATDVDEERALWRISLEAGARPRLTYEGDWIDVVEAPDGVFAEAPQSESPQARPAGVYRLDVPSGPFRLTPDIAVPGGLRWCVSGGFLYYIDASETGARVYSRPIGGGAINAIATVGPNVDYGLSVDPRTGDLVYARTDRTKIDIAVAPLRRTR